MTIIFILVPTLVILFLILDNHRLRLEISEARKAFKKVLVSSMMYQLGEFTFPELNFKKKLAKKVKKVTKKK